MHLTAFAKDRRELLAFSHYSSYSTVWKGDGLGATWNVIKQNKVIYTQAPINVQHSYKVSPLYLLTRRTRFVKYRTRCHQMNAKKGPHDPVFSATSIWPKAHSSNTVIGNSTRSGQLLPTSMHMPSGASIKWNFLTPLRLNLGPSASIQKPLRKSIHRPAQDVASDGTSILKYWS